MKPPAREVAIAIPAEIPATVKFADVKQALSKPHVMLLWCVWSILPYFLTMGVSGLLFQLSVIGLQPLLNIYLRGKS